MLIGAKSPVTSKYVLDAMILRSITRHVEACARCNEVRREHGMLCDGQSRAQSN